MRTDAEKRREQKDRKRRPPAGEASRSKPCLQAGKVAFAATITGFVYCVKHHSCVAFTNKNAPDLGTMVY